MPPRADTPVFTKIFKVNRKSDEASQALAICTHGVAGAKYFELPLDPASPCNAVLGTKPKVVFFGATQADVQTDQALSVLHPWISQAYAYYLIYKHDFFENQGLGIQLVYPGAHPGCGNVAAIEVIECKLPPAGALVAPSTPVTRICTVPRWTWSMVAV